MRVKGTEWERRGLHRVKNGKNQRKDDQNRPKKRSKSSKSPSERKKTTTIDADLFRKAIFVSSSRSRWWNTDATVDCLYHFRVCVMSVNTKLTHSPSPHFSVAIHFAIRRPLIRAVFSLAPSSKIVQNVSQTRFRKTSSALKCGCWCMPCCLCV